MTIDNSVLMWAIGGIASVMCALFVYIFFNLKGDVTEIKEGQKRLEDKIDRNDQKVAIKMDENDKQNRDDHRVVNEHLTDIREEISNVRTKVAALEERVNFFFGDRS